MLTCAILVSSTLIDRYVSRVHGMYIELDDDNNGLLSRTEFQSYVMEPLPLPTPLTGI